MSPHDLKNLEKVDFDTNQITQKLFKWLPEDTNQPTINILDQTGKFYGGGVVVEGGRRLEGTHTHFFFFFKERNEMRE